MSLQRYNLPSVALHWLTAAAALLQVPLAWYMIDQRMSPEKFANYALHKSIGVTIFALTALRLAWRTLHRPPAPVAMPAWQLHASTATHWTLYMLLFAMPLTGWMNSSAANFPVSVFGLFTLPNLVSPDAALQETMESIHEWLSYLFIGLVLVHAVAALHHHAIARDATLARMVPWLRPRGQPAP
jgi:cytochrome b561